MHVSPPAPCQGLSAGAPRTSSLGLWPPGARAERSGDTGTGRTATGWGDRAWGGGRPGWSLPHLSPLSRSVHSHQAGAERNQHLVGREAPAPRDVAPADDPGPQHTRARTEARMYFV